MIWQLLEWCWGSWELEECFDWSSELRLCRSHSRLCWSQCPRLALLELCWSWWFSCSLSLDNHSSQWSKSMISQSWTTMSISRALEPLFWLSSGVQQERAGTKWCSTWDGATQFCFSAWRVRLWRRLWRMITRDPAVVTHWSQKSSSLSTNWLWLRCFSICLLPSSLMHSLAKMISLSLSQDRCPFRGLLSCGPSMTPMQQVS